MLERARRWRARKRGEVVSLQAPGPKPGFKQSPEHVAKRTRTGEDHHAWVGDAVSKKGGRSRALRRYRDIGPCSQCGSTIYVERHHRDRNTANNAESNIAILCKACHAEAHRLLDASDALLREGRDSHLSG